MSYKIAGIDIHKRMVAVVVADVAGEGEYQFERRKFGSGGEQLRLLAAWLVANEIEEVVMESTAQYWKPVWEALNQATKDWHSKVDSAISDSATFPNLELFPLCPLLLLSPSPLASKRSFW